MRSSSSSEAVREPFDLESAALALAAADETFVIWKGGRELTSQGDLDCAASRSSWSALTNAFRAWAASHGFAAVIECEHALGRLILVGSRGDADRRLLQVDLVDELVVHGAPVWTARDAAASTVADGNVPHTTPGAEGLLRLLADPADRQAPGLVAADRRGAGVVASRLGARGRLAARGAAGWPRRALAAVLAVRPVAHPRAFVRAVRSNRARNACPVLAALRDDRTVQEPVDVWLAAVATGHRIHRISPT